MEWQLVNYPATDVQPARVDSRCAKSPFLLPTSTQENLYFYDSILSVNYGKSDLRL